MNPYQFSDLFLRQSYPSIYSNHFIRLILLFKGYTFQEITRILVYEKKSEWVTFHQILDPHIQYICAEKKEEITGDFDLIIVNASEQKDYAEVIQKHLKEKGLVCIHYGAMPGCAPVTALRDLMLLQISPHAKGEERKMQALQALYFTDNYSQTSAAIFKEIPRIKEVLETIKKEPFESLDENWLNPNWKPLYFSDIAKKLEGFDFISSLHLPLELDFCIPEEVAKMVQEEDDILLKETIRDFGLNQLIRTDLFARGVVEIPQDQLEKTLNDFAFCLTCPRTAISSIQIPSPKGNLVFDEEIYMQFLDALADDFYRPKTISQLKEHPLLKGVDTELFLAVIHLLIASNAVFPAHLKVATEVEVQCAKQNKIQCEAMMAQKGLPILISPVLGSCVLLSRIGLLILLNFVKGGNAEECAKAVFALLKNNRENLLDSNGQPMSDVDSIAFLTKNAKMYIDTIFPYLKAIKAIPSHS